MAEHGRRMAMERMRAHLARAEYELGDALRFLDPKSTDETEIALVRATANARISVGTPWRPSG